MKNHNKEKGFVLVFVIAVVSALSIMTGAMFFYYDNDLKSLISKFQENFKKFNLGNNIISAGPGF